MLRKSKALLTIVVLGGILAGCGAESAAPAPTEPSAVAPTQAAPTLAATQAASAPALAEGEVTFKTADGVELSGTVYGQGPVGVVLAHQNGGSQQEWAAFAQQLGAQGYTALTFDLRGFGKSYERTKVNPKRNTIATDAQAAIAFLRENGFSKIVCIGASMGGTACAKAAREPGLAGLVVLSSPTMFGVTIAQDDLKDLSYPSLFLAAKGDQNFSSEVTKMSEWSGAASQIKIFDGSAHGVGLLSGATEAETRSLIVTLLQGVLTT